MFAGTRNGPKAAALRKTGQLEEEMKQGYRWQNEPSSWQGDETELALNTDFWRETFLVSCATAATRICGRYPAISPLWPQSVTEGYEELYDQAGLMLRLDEANWIKCAISNIPTG